MHEKSSKLLWAAGRAGLLDLICKIAAPGSAGSERALFVRSSCARDIAADIDSFRDSGARTFACAFSPALAVTR